MVKLEILEKAIIKAKYPAMYYGKLILRPALLYRCRLDNISALLNNIQLNQLVVLVLLRAAVLDHIVHFRLMQSVDVADVTQPGVQETHILWCHGSLDTTTAVVAADNDVLDFEVTDSVVDDGHDVEVDVVDEVGNVAMDEHLAGLEAGDGFGGDT